MCNEQCAMPVAIPIAHCSLLILARESPHRCSPPEGREQEALVHNPRAGPFGTGGSLGRGGPPPALRRDGGDAERAPWTLPANGHAHEHRRALAHGPRGGEPRE